MSVFLRVLTYINMGHLKATVPEIKFLFWPIYSRHTAVTPFLTLLNVEGLKMIVPGFLNRLELNTFIDKYFLCKKNQLKVQASVA